MRILPAIIVASILSMPIACAKPGDEPIVEQEKTDEEGSSGEVFGSKTYTGGSVKLPYRVAEINPAKDETGAAIVLYLHGGSAKGSDNQAQLTAEVYGIRAFLEESGMHAIMLVPQCPASYNAWAEGAIGQTVKAFLDSYAADGRTDAGKVYIMGGSMGGIGTMGFLNLYPGYFKAGMPVACQVRGCKAANIAKTPIYVVMGTEDRNKDFDEIEGFFDEVRSLGGTVDYDKVEGWTHGETCQKAYTQERLKKLFSY